MLVADHGRAVGPPLDVHAGPGGQLVGDLIDERVPVRLELLLCQAGGLNRRVDADSGCLWVGVVGGHEESVEEASEVAFEGTDRFAAGLALLDPALNVLLGRWVQASTGDRDHVQRPVELTVPAAVQPVSVAFA